MLTDVAKGNRISARGFFNKLRPLITEPDDLFSYNKKASSIYRGILNLLNYKAKGLKDWKSAGKIDMSMNLEDHHIFPRAYVSSSTALDVVPAEAEQLVDCVLNRTLIPKILNIKIGKNPPTIYLSEIKQNNPQLAGCLVSHLIPQNLIDDETWNRTFKVFLEERAGQIFSLIEEYTIKPQEEIFDKFSSRETDSSDNAAKSIKTPKVLPKLKDILPSGLIKIGDEVFIRRKPEKVAKILDGDSVEFEGTKMLINTWAQQMTGWTSVNIYDQVTLKRTGDLLKVIRDEFMANQR